jgi:hypothetical protein
MQPLVQLIVCLLVAAELNGAEAIYCNRDPEDIYTPKSKNSPFQIRISGNPDKYVPEGLYTGKVVTSFFLITVRISYRVQQHTMPLV